MKFPKIFKKEAKKNTTKDLYQRSINRIGRAQLMRIAEKGLSVPVGSF